MSDLFWPGDERAGELMTQEAWLAAMVAVEQAWLDALAASGIAPGSASLDGLVSVEEVAADAEAGGNPVLGLVRLLRSRAAGPGAPWIHRGLTSQDVVDSGLVLCLRTVVTRVQAELRAEVEALARLSDSHRGSLMTGRTLTQPAVPITFGLKAATWLSGVLDAAERLETLVFPAQFGAAAGTLAAVAELASGPDAARRLVTDATSRLGLAPAPPWHTGRGAITAIADALVSCTDTWGRIAGDVLVLTRAEIGELAEPAGPAGPAGQGGRGGSSTMPHKRNPVLSTLLRRAAIAAPPLASTLHLAAALADDERSAGPWHAEWSALHQLGRRTIVAGSQATELLAGLQVDAERMAANARSVWDELTAERDAVAAFAGTTPSEGDYLGATGAVIDTALARARTWLEAHQ